MNPLDWHLLEDRPTLDSVALAGRSCAPGDRVRIRPKPNADIMDVALAGRIAIIESIEQDYEGRTQVALVMEDDPGKDLGLMRQPGHRFFFAPEELEPL